jgi:two-component system response regulator FixJ
MDSFSDGKKSCRSASTRKCFLLYTGNNPDKAKLTIAAAPQQVAAAGRQSPFETGRGGISDLGSSAQFTRVRAERRTAEGLRQRSGGGIRSLAGVTGQYEFDASVTVSDASPLVYIVDEDCAVRDSLQWLLESVGLCACPFTDLDAFLTAYQAERPGCLLLDIRIPGYGDLSAQQFLGERKIDLPVIVMTGHGDVPTVVAAMKRGAIDFIQKPFNDQLLLDCVHNAIAEDRARRRARAWRQDLRCRFDTLTPREQEVLGRIAQGLSNREIAGALNLSRKTVEVHRAKIMQKMQADTLSDLIQMAMALGILKLYDRET